MTIRFHQYVLEEGKYPSTNDIQYTSCVNEYINSVYTGIWNRESEPRGNFRILSNQTNKLITKSMFAILWASQEEEDPLEGIHVYALKK